MLVDAGFSEDQIIIQRIVEANGKYEKGTHAAIYVKLSDGRILIPDITAPLTTDAKMDLYNIRAGNKTSGFMIINLERIQNIIETPAEIELGYKLLNLDKNNNEINLTKEEKIVFEKIASYMFGMVINPETIENASSMSKEDLQKIIKTKQAEAIAKENKFFDKILEDSKEEIKHIDETIVEKLEIDPLFEPETIKQGVEDLRANIDGVDIKPEIRGYNFETLEITDEFLNLDKIRTKNMLMIQNYLKESLNNDRIKTLLNGNQIKTQMIAGEEKSYIKIQVTNKTTTNNYICIEDNGIIKIIPNNN